MRILLAFILTLGLITTAYAERQFQPAQLTYGGYPSKAEYCQAQGVGYYGKPYAYMTSGPYAGTCCSDAYGGYTCQQQYEVSVKSIPQASETCLEGWTRDPAKAGTDPEACYYDPPESDCSDKEGESAGHFVQTCYIVHCPPRFFMNNAGAIACSSGRTNTYIDPPSPINVSGCEARIKHRSMLDRPRPSSDVGQTAGTVECDDEYEFTGQESSESPSPLTPTPTAPASPPTNSTDRDPPTPPANPTDPANPSGPQSGAAPTGTTTPGGNSGNHSGQAGTGTNPSDGPGRNAGNPNHGGRDTSNGNGAGAGGDVNDLKAPEIKDTSSWWDSDYKDGLAGVWEEKKGALLETRMGSFATNWGVPDAGTCPQWTMNLWRVGSVQLQPPCWIWPAIKALMYFCTILLCRALIFGG